MKKGLFYLVSVGVGDPDNITIKAHKTIQQADVVFASSSRQALFAELLEGKEVHDVGHGMFTPMQRRNMSEDDAAALEAQTRRIIREAVSAGKTVAVLDYGDLAVYGPQSGYMNEFRDLSPIVIPGVSSFNAANAALVTDITDGLESQSVTLTIAKQATADYDGPDALAKLAATRATLAFFTMKTDLADVVQQLRRSYPADTPIAIVMHAGDYEQQRVIRATLDTILARLGDTSLPFEHMIYVGDALRHVPVN